MKESNFLILLIGFLAQLFFSARILYQWILSERAKQVVSPSIFWILSIAGSYLLCIYGWMRNDLSIIVGQFISYYIYIWNLKEKGVWEKSAFLIKSLLLITPIIAATFALNDFSNFTGHFIHNEEIPYWLLLFGTAGQLIFTLRFVYQWYYSYQHHQSLLPTGFWLISLTGSFIIIIYGIIRLDPVLILGQSIGFIAYSRNLIIGFKYAKVESINR